MTNGKFDALFGGPPREPDEPLTQRHMDLAASADLDCLAIGNCFLRKVEQDPSLKREYAESFEPD